MKRPCIDSAVGGKRPVIRVVEEAGSTLDRKQKVAELTVLATWWTRGVV